MKWRRVLGVVMAVAMVFSYSPVMYAYAEYVDAGDLFSQPMQKEETAPAQEETQPLNSPSEKDNQPTEDEVSSQPQDEETNLLPVCTCGSESDIHTKEYSLYVPPKTDPVQEFLDAVADLQKFHEDEGDGAEEQLALERAVIDGYDALSDEQKAYLGEEYAEMVKTLRGGANPLTLTGAGTESNPYIINNGGDLWDAINASNKASSDEIYYFEFQGTVTAQNFGIYVASGSNATISDSHIISDGYKSETVSARGASKVRIERSQIEAVGGEVLSKERPGGYGVAFYDDDTEVEIIDSEVSAVTYAVSGYGTGGCKNTLKVTGGSLIGQGAAIYLPQNGDATIKNVKMEGMSGISIKGGRLSLQGNTEIHATGPLLDPSQEYGNGTIPNGSGIQIEANKNYTGGIQVTVSDQVKIVSDNGVAICQYGSVNDHLNEIHIAAATVDLAGGEGQPEILVVPENKGKVKIARGSLLVN